MNGNFKVRCVDLRGYNLGTYKKGSVYGVVNGYLIAEDGCRIGHGCFSCVDDVNVFSSSIFESVDADQSIIIYRKDREVIASIKEGKKVIKSAKATCNSSDTFDFEVGAKLAFKRLIGEDIKTAPKPVSMFDWESFKSGNFAAHCDTKEKAREFLKECDNRDITWVTGEKATEYIGAYGAMQCYNLNQCFGKCTTQAGVDYYTRKGFTIIEYPFSKPTVKEVHRPAKVGEWIKIVNSKHPHDFSTGEVYEVKNLQSCYGNKDAVIIGKTFVVLEEDYVVLENYQPEEKPYRPFLDIYSTDELLTEIKRRMKNE